MNNNKTTPSLLPENSFYFIDKAIDAADLLAYGKPTHTRRQIVGALLTACETGEYKCARYTVTRHVTLGGTGSSFYTFQIHA